MQHQDQRKAIVESNYEGVGGAGQTSLLVVDDSTIKLPSSLLSRADSGGSTTSSSSSSSSVASATTASSLFSSNSEDAKDRRSSFASSVFEGEEDDNSSKSYDNVVTDQPGASLDDTTSVPTPLTSRLPLARSSSSQTSSSSSGESYILTTNMATPTAELQSLSLSTITVDPSSLSPRSASGSNSNSKDISATTLSEDEAHSSNSIKGTTPKPHISRHLSSTSPEMLRLAQRVTSAGLPFPFPITRSRSQASSSSSTSSSATITPNKIHTRPSISSLSSSKLLSSEGFPWTARSSSSSYLSRSASSSLLKPSSSSSSIVSNSSNALLASHSAIFSDAVEDDEDEYNDALYSHSSRTDTAASTSTSLADEMHSTATHRDAAPTPAQVGSADDTISNAQMTTKCASSVDHLHSSSKSARLAQEQVCLKSRHGFPSTSSPFPTATPDHYTSSSPSRSSQHDLHSSYRESRSQGDASSPSRVLALSSYSLSNSRAINDEHHTTSISEVDPLARHHQAPSSVSSQESPNPSFRHEPLMATAMVLQSQPGLEGLQCSSTRSSTVSRLNSPSLPLRGGKSAMTATLSHTPSKQHALESICTPGNAFLGAATSSLLNDADVLEDLPTSISSSNRARNPSIDSLSASVGSGSSGKSHTIYLHGAPVVNSPWSSGSSCGGNTTLSSISSTNSNSSSGISATGLSYHAGPTGTSYGPGRPTTASSATSGSTRPWVKDSDASSIKSTGSMSDRSSSVDGNEKEPSVMSPAAPPPIPFLSTGPSPKGCKVTVDATISQHFYVVVTLPGFSHENITLALKRNGSLHILADKYEDGSVNSEAGHFERMVELGDSAIGSKVKAEFNGSQLKVYINKRGALHSHAKTSPNHRNSNQLDMQYTAPPPVADSHISQYGYGHGRSETYGSLPSSPVTHIASATYSRSNL